jgi:hypothetical protein
MTRVLALIESASGGQVLGHAGITTTLEVGARERGADLRAVSLPPP